MENNIETTLRELAIIWGLLPDAAITKTSRHSAHPVTLDRREPYHFDIIDLSDQIQPVITELAHLFGLLTPDDTGNIPTGQIAQALTVMVNIAATRASEPAWTAINNAGLTAINNSGVLTRAHRLLGDDDPGIVCPTCRNEVVINQTTVSCPVCDTTATWISLREAAENLGISLAALRKQCQRHTIKAIHINGTWLYPWHQLQNCNTNS